MKIIQAMKKLKDLNGKAEDLRTKIGLHSANLSMETLVYPNQAQMVAGWLQSHSDILKEIENLRLAIQRTNLATQVTIEVSGNQVTKPIAAWIHRRRDLAGLEEKAWGQLTDRKLKETNVQTAPGGPVTAVTIVRHYNPEQRDGMVSAFKSEPSLIDGTLEVVNATTELV
jgi:hypothetical protein